MKFRFRIEMNLKRKLIEKIQTLCSLFIQTLN